ncbi:MULTISPECIES: helix-turn-helix domain-containing protein [Leuconostoc gelidum group]|uniref:helix-turn-helix domain-containing protein n=1 Tax=Leuconostoc gelidum group TaxID=3016637 RepID=UPI0002193770|nr:MULTISPECIES: helix-turn-helix transcriptional regulator [Leuconostoc gelidum group]MBR2276786.1 helix-turn-helix transcriptional regulator [Leuconostoc sp.]AFS39684.1 XRE family transcriptional regulator [Leuconostoc gelidum JB7]MBZ5953747.1 helix-turn-helix transcriptional regulator [Leuconostoc gasicomitatum]MBZ5955218.1 helix-turn-helix transcriptional regulator [Leuconostoc gasicomitatum]MBZ5987570.1 helix-turn-helix transcriptional regulator [Leuconostoc gasicomitatum]
MINVEKFIHTRKRLKMSQMSLCINICTQATLSKFEKHRQVPAVDIMILLCERLGLTLNDIFPIHVTLKTTSNEQVLALAMKALFYQNLVKYHQLMTQVDIDNLLDSEQSTYQLLQYFSLVFFQKNDVKATKLLKKIDVSQFSQLQQLLFYAITIHYYYQQGFFNEAEKIFDDVWRHQKNLMVADRSGFQAAIFYLLAQYQMSLKNYKYAMMLATYGINFTNDSDSTYFLENLFWLLIEAGDIWHNQHFIVNEMINNVRMIAKFHKNESMLNKINQRKKDI